MGLSSSPRRRTLRIDLEFDGTEFEGWQRQASGRTVQREVERALSRVLGAPHRVVGCGRTDAGVHARQMVVSARLTHAPARAMAVAEVERALDAVLPDDIGVLSVREAPADFHAQRHARWKWYRYRVLVSRRKRPLTRRRAWRIASAPPIDGLEAAVRPLRGRHDFRSFANRGSSPGATTVRTLHALQWTRRGARLVLDAVGDGFLYRMVRTIVATTLRAAAEADPEATVTAIRDARDRRAAGSVAPAVGLTLMAVAMAGEEPPNRVPGFLLRRVDLDARPSLGGSS